MEARDFSWLVSALDQLRTARRVLCNSYAFAYFFFGGALFAEDFSEEQNRTNQQLFEDNQEMLAAEVGAWRGVEGRGAGCGGGQGRGRALLAAVELGRTGMGVQRDRLWRLPAQRTLAVRCLPALTPPRDPRPPRARSQVERLSGLADGAAKQLSLDAELRLNVINSAANIGTRIGNLFSLIENDLYARISSCAAQIAVPR